MTAAANDDAKGIIRDAVAKGDGGKVGLGLGNADGPETARGQGDDQIGARDDAHGAPAFAFALAGCRVSGESGHKGEQRDDIEHEWV